MAGKQFGDLNAATEQKADDLYAIRQDRGSGVYETRKITAEIVFQWIRSRLGMAARRDTGTGADQVPLNSDLGSASKRDTSYFATAAQGGRADSAVQPGDLKPVATSGAYDDLTGKPTLGDLAAKDKAHIVNDTTATLPISRGGTNATTAAAARTNLGIGALGTKDKAEISGDTEGTLPVNRGGTGAGDAAGARTALGLAYASKAEAEAGTVNNKSMSPLRTLQAIAALAKSGFGSGQKYLDVKSSRSHSTVYQNTTGRPMLVSINGERGGSTSVGLLQVREDGEDWVTAAQIGSVRTNMTAVVNAGAEYRVQGAFTIYHWAEYR